MHRTLRFLALSLLTMAGCSVSAVQTARTNGQGNLQVGLEPGVLGAGAGGVGGVWPAMDVAVRYGISDRVDLGGRMGSSSGVEFQSKFQLTGDDGVVVALAPSLITAFVAAGGAGGGFVSVPVPLLVDVPLGESTLVLGPRLRPTFAYGAGGGVTASGVGLSGGGTLGIALPVADTVKLLPEFGAELPLSGGVGVAWSGRVGVLFGNTK